MKTLVSLLALIALIAIGCKPAYAAERNYSISTLDVRPVASGNGTNTAIFRDKTGTNWLSISPTNATLQLKWQGTNYTAMSTNLWITNGGVAYPLKIRNGIFVQ